MNKASQKVNYLFNHYCSSEAIADLTHDKYLVNLIDNFHGDFSSYLCRHCRVRVLSFRELDGRSKEPVHTDGSLDDLCVFDINTEEYRPIQEKDAGVIQKLIKKWYQCSNEINLRIELLFNSKLGSKFLSKQTHVPEKLISEARHEHISINDLGPERRLNLENYYLNSHFARRIRNLHVMLKV